MVCGAFSSNKILNDFHYIHIINAASNETSFYQSQVVYLQSLILSVPSTCTALSPCFLSINKNIPEKSFLIYSVKLDSDLKKKNSPIVYYSGFPDSLHIVTYLSPIYSPILVFSLQKGSSLLASGGRLFLESKFNCYSSYMLSWGVPFTKIYACLVIVEKEIYLVSNRYELTLAIMEPWESCDALLSSWYFHI